MKTMDGGRSFLWAAHYCAALATYPEVVTHRAGTFPPKRNPPLFGLAPCGVCPATVIAGGAVRSCRTFSPLPDRPKPAGRYVFCGTFRQRPFESRRPDVIRHTALWSSDFPLMARFVPTEVGITRAGSDRPAQQLTAIIIGQVGCRRMNASMLLEMEFEIAARYKSAAQRARVVTELWGERNLYCANCESPVLLRFAPNAQAVDFGCPDCHSAFQLKSQSSAFSRRIVDAGYAAMRRAIREDRTPNLIALHYDRTCWRIKNVLLVPNFAFSMSVIEKRPPLAATARRAGWVGCNILLCNIPVDARIDLVRDGIPADPAFVRGRYSQLRPLASLNADLRGWTLDVLNVARSLNKKSFSLEEMYVHDAELGALHPGNRNVRPKIRQQLQRLRDLGLIRFLRPGYYAFGNSDLNHQTL